MKDKLPPVRDKLLLPPFQQKKRRRVLVPGIGIIGQVVQPSPKVMEVLGVPDSLSGLGETLSTQGPSELAISI